MSNPVVPYTKEQEETLVQIAGKTRAEWIRQYPLLQRLIDLRESSWFNPSIERDTAAALARVGLDARDVADAADRLKRFAPYIAQVFADTEASGGIIESPLVAIPHLQRTLQARSGQAIGGQMWAKLDSQLPISGSIKARGGIHEVLQHAERLALDAGLLRLDDDYRKLDTGAARAFFSRHQIAVGSTGNLGLSIGIMSAQLGFRVTVHMSADARQWKKDRLRAQGVEVIEYASDYSAAVAAGRRQAQATPGTHFIDDENSTSLFLGYAVAGRRLAGQLQALDVRVGEQAPLLVYLPCGVGGGPGGVAFGLKTVLGGAVRCFFAEPTHSPAMLIGLMTDRHDALSVQDFGIDNATVADGLAVGRPSGFVGKRMKGLIDGCYTISDEALFRLVAELAHGDAIRIEPSAAAGLVGALRVQGAAEYRARMGLSDEVLQRATHLAWITGGSMVPQAEMDGYIATGDRLLQPG